MSDSASGSEARTSGAAFAAPLAFAALLLAAPCGARMPPGGGGDDGRAPAAIFANRPPNQFAHNVGLLTLQVTNMGIIGNPWSDDLVAAWRGAEFLYQASLIVAAVTPDGEPRASVSIRGRSIEFRPYQQLAIDTIYPSYEGIAGGNRAGFFSADDDGDGLEDEDFRNGKDDDGDGKVDEDFAAIGQQMLSCEYRDDTPDAVTQSPGHHPLGLKVLQRSFQWGASGINEFVGFDFTIVNVGDQRLRNIYLGFYVDADVGPKSSEDMYLDDLPGFARIDTVITRTTLDGSCARQPLKMDIAYMSDVPDDGEAAHGGDTPGFLGTLFLGHSTDPTGVKAPVRVGLRTVKWTNSSAPYPRGDPDTDLEMYDLLSSGSIPRRAPVEPDDYRFTLSAGPFEQLGPGDRLTFQTAVLVGDGYDGMLENAINAQRVYDGTYIDADHDEMTGVDGNERCLAVLDPPGQILWDDPCDTLTTTRSWRRSDCLWVDDDCDPCTGVEGKEFLLHWVGTTGPPPPVMNTDPDLQSERLRNPATQVHLQSPGRDRHVVLQWDNLSELRPDPITGRNLFEGYRIWRVDNWRRPEGSLGPAPEEWMLVDEYRLNPRDRQGAISPRHLRRVERRDRNEIVEMTRGGPLYPVGRYEWADSSGVINGTVHFYAVTAFGIDRSTNPETGEIVELEIGSLPTAVQRQLVVSSWDAGTSCDDVRVVPNPYRGGADWDLNPSGCDATGTRIAFTRLPEGWTQIEIYSLAGDLVFAGDLADSRVLGGCEVAHGLRREGTFYWDLITRSGQDLVAGIYLYAIRAPGGPCRGRFVIIR